jgi:hypothetical protein
MFCKPDMPQRVRSPTLVTEQYNKFICDEMVPSDIQIPITVTGEKDNT